MKHRRRSRALASIVAALVLIAAAACGGDTAPTASGDPDPDSASPLDDGAALPTASPLTDTETETETETEEALPSTTPITAATSPAPSGAGFVEEIFVDDSRATPRSGYDPGSDARRLRTLVAYPADTDPATGLVADATPSPGAAPYPLVLFSHGLGATPESYRDLITALTVAGHVVVAPEFPRTGASNPGGPDAGDTEAQPGDISFLIDTISELASDPDWSLHGLVDLERITAIGHSNGAITTYGLASNSCCRDERIDVAVAIAGTPSPFAGAYDFADATPMLLIHGTDDVLIPYAASVGTFNDLEVIKALLTLEGGDHSAGLGATNEFFDDTIAAIVDFSAWVIDGDADAAGRLAEPRASEAAELDFDPDGGTDTTVESETDELERSVSVSQTTDLVDGQIVTVSWSGFLPGQVVNIVQCSGGGLAGSAFCDLTKGLILQPNPNGEGRLDLEIIVGPVGAGTCDATTVDCVIIVNDASLPDPEATILVPISFAPA